MDTGRTIAIQWPHLPCELSDAWRTAYDQKGVADAAWKHFEPLLTAKGYDIIWLPDDDVGIPVNVTERNAAFTRHDADILPEPAHPFWPQPGEALNGAAFSRSERVWLGINGHFPVIRTAYDLEARMVIIKATRTSSSEITMLRYLTSPHQRYDSRNRTIPVIDLISTHQWTFVVMPFWAGTPYLTPPCIFVSEYVFVARQLLEGLCFMHERGIAHLDLHRDNVVLNHFTYEWPVWDATTYIPFLSEFNAQFAYIDFEYSTRGIHAVAEAAFPLSYHSVPEIGWVDWVPYPYEDPRGPLKRADVVHDPFAADVWMLGCLLREQIETHEKWGQRQSTVAEDERPTARLRRDLPGYLELIARMMHDDPRARPSAAEALGILAQVEHAMTRTGG